ncbi:MAG: alpha-galactosidase [Lachnospiraceae bacterium]|nr:alpha-galactosidase [Lachnospiraceae bacterium]
MIVYHENAVGGDIKRFFTIHTKHTTYQMMADAFGVLLHLYYGRRSHGEMDFLVRCYDRGFSGNPYDVSHNRTYSLDVLPQEFPCFGTGDYRRTAVMIEQKNGTASCDLRYHSYSISDGKYSLPGLPAVYAEDGDGAETLHIILRDRWDESIEVELLYGVLPDMDIITRSVIVRNRGKETWFVKRIMSASLDFISGSFDLMTFYGRHGMERTAQRKQLLHGVYTIGSDRGMSSHQYNPFMILSSRSTGEDSGACYAMQFVYSGGFQGVAERDPFDQIRLQMGLMNNNFHWPLKGGEEFTAPEVILSYSSEGFAGLSHNLHDCLRTRVCRGPWRDITRPLLLNSWEGCYFSFNGERILRLAEDAKDLGLDMIVMDDGWFGKRDNDMSGLGDWTFNEKKLGMTLRELTDRVNAMGMKFGIWVEPEMVNEDSDLYRAHPDYALAIPGREPIRARSQLVLDFSRKEVADAIFSQICAMLDSGHIEYIKWDYNRSIADVYSHTAEDQGTVLHKYILGLYDFLERLRERYPDLLIEGCSGGGGRFDAGMLYYTPQIWCSDNTDAIDRLRIQHGTSYGYPCSAVGAHVSVCPNHQCGRTTPLSTRGVVAMGGTFGYELDPATLTDEEKETVRGQIALYREFAPLIAEGLYYRLSNPLTAKVAAWMHVSRDKSQALVNAVNLETHFNSPQRYIKLRGLDPEGMYHLTDTAGDEGSVTWGTFDYKSVFAPDDKEIMTDRLYSGAALMEIGFPVPLKMGEYGAYQWHLYRMI